MNYIPVRIDKNTNNVWKWKRLSDNAIGVVPAHLFKPADQWAASELLSLFDNAPAAHIAPAPVQAPVQASESEYAPSDDDDEDENFNPNVNDDDDEEESTPAVTTTATI
jgi:hypothetical protein